MHRAVRAAHQEAVADRKIYRSRLQDTLGAPGRQMRPSPRPHRQFCPAEIASILREAHMDKDKDLIEDKDMQGRKRADNIL